MRAVDFFSGAGGFTTGAHLAGARVVLAVNHCADAIACHAANHPDVEHVQQDLAELDMRSLPAIDLLIASPECQGFTPAGRTGRTNPVTPAKLRRDGRRLRARNTSYAVLAAADVVRPKLIVVENVPEFLEWDAFDAWCGMLRAHGYHVQAHLITASDYGGASQRRRAILTASLRAPIVLDCRTRSARTIGECLLEDGDPRCRWGAIADRSDSMRDRMRRVQQRFGSRVAWANVDHAIGRREDQQFATITTRSLSQLFLLDGDRCRPLEAREVARAMSFPDTYQLPEERSLAGRLIGNAIDCNVARGVIEQVLAA